MCVFRIGKCELWRWLKWIYGESLINGRAHGHIRINLRHKFFSTKRLWRCDVTVEFIKLNLSLTLTESCGMRPLPMVRLILFIIIIIFFCSAARADFIICLEATIFNFTMSRDVAITQSFIILQRARVMLPLTLTHSRCHSSAKFPFA